MPSDYALVTWTLLAAVFGHFVADYLLQPKLMAVGKSASGWRGLAVCSLHSLIYTLCVCTFSWETTHQYQPLFALLVFASHFPIDRWSLASKWLKLTGGRDFMIELVSRDPYRDIHLSFATVVYAIADNTLHLVLLWVFVNCMMK